MYKYHVLADRSIADPGLPPHYSASFFTTIRKVANESPLNAVNMSLKQWYRLLLEETVTMSMNGNVAEYIPCRVEIISPNTD